MIERSGELYTTCIFSTQTLKLSSTSFLSFKKIIHAYILTRSKIYNKKENLSRMVYITDEYNLGFGYFLMKDLCS